MYIENCCGKECPYTEQLGEEDRVFKSKRDDCQIFLQVGNDKNLDNPWRLLEQKSLLSKLVWKPEMQTMLIAPTVHEGNASLFATVFCRFPSFLSLAVKILDPLWASQRSHEGSPGLSALSECTLINCTRPAWMCDWIICGSLSHMSVCVCEHTQNQ